MNEYDENLQLIQEDLELAFNCRDFNRLLFCRQLFTIWLSAKLWVETLPGESCDHTIGFDYTEDGGKFYKFNDASHDPIPNCYFNFCPDCGQKLRR